MKNNNKITIYMRYCHVNSKLQCLYIKIGNLFTCNLIPLCCDSYFLQCRYLYGTLQAADASIFVFASESTLKYVIHDGDVMGRPIATQGNKFQYRIRDYHPLLA